MHLVNASLSISLSLCLSLSMPTNPAPTATMPLPYDYAAPLHHNTPMLFCMAAHNNPHLIRHQTSPYILNTFATYYTVPA